MGENKNNLYLQFMRNKRFRDILCACLVMLMLPCSAYIIRGNTLPFIYLQSEVADSVTVQADSSAVSDSLALPDSLSVPDSALTDSTLLDSTLLDSMLLDSTLLDSMLLDSTMRDSTLLDSMATDTVLTKWDLKRMAKDSAKYVRDSIKALKDSIRWSQPRVLETGFVPDTLFYEKILAWNTGPYVNEFKLAHMDTTFNDWYTEYPFYKEDIDAVYLGTIGSAVQNVNFFKRWEFDNFKAYAPYLTYSHIPANLQFFNTKSPYTELAYWGTLFAFKDKEEINVRFLHTQNITPEWNLAVLFQGWKAAGIMTREATSNNSLEITTNYLGRNYALNAGFIHHNITREENGGIQDSHMVRDTTVDAKTLAINLQNAQNKLSRNTFYLSHSYSISLRGNKHKEEVSDTLASADSLSLALPALSQDSSAAPSHVASPATSAATSPAASPVASVVDSTSSMAGDSLMAEVPAADSSMLAQSTPTGKHRKKQKEVDMNPGLDSAEFKALGQGPMLTIGHIGEVSRYYRYYTDQISANDEVGRNFYNNMFYINPTTSADSSRVLTVENKLFFKLQPWARDAVVSEVTGGLGYQFNSIYAFQPQMFLTGNSNIHQHNMYVYAGAAGQYKKYFSWGADAKYSFLGYYQNDFDVNAHIDVSFYPFKDKSEPITLSGRFNTSLKEPDWYSQHYYSNHYIWDNDFGKTSTTKVEATLNIPKWRLEAFFGYALVNNYLYNDTTGIIRQHSGLLNVMSAYVRKDFKLWWFHLDNQVLFQMSSDDSVLPLPMLTFRMKYYLEIEAVKNVLTLQLGADVRFNTLYYAPAYNPALGTFQLQTQEKIGNNPYIDVFLNLQWYKVNIFLKVINVGEGWPDGGMMFSAYHYIRPTLGFKFGIHWPFYIE